MKIWYFGCWHGMGHYLWNEVNGTESMYSFESPFGPGYTNLDTMFCPGADPKGWGTPEKAQGQGNAWLHHKDGWSYLAFWDRTQDHRGNSNSGFLVDHRFSSASPEPTFEEIWALAKQKFPTIVERLEAAGGVRIVERHGWGP